MNKIFIPSQQIGWQIKKIANKINKSHDLEKDKVVFICVLKGASLFFNDLIKRIKIKNLEIEYVYVNSYENNLKLSSNEKYINKGKVILNTLPSKLSYYWEKTFYIIDDIAETGETLKFLGNYIGNKSSYINNIRFITLLKRKSYDGILFDYGFEIKDEGWIYGYGLDDDGFNRHLKDIYIKTLKV